MKPVFSLVKDYGLSRVDNFVGDLFSPVGREAVHK